MDYIIIVSRMPSNNEKIGKQIVLVQIIWIHYSNIIMY